MRGNDGLRRTTTRADDAIEAIFQGFKVSMYPLSLADRQSTATVLADRVAFTRWSRFGVASYASTKEVSSNCQSAEDCIIDNSRMLSFHTN